MERTNPYAGMSEEQLEAVFTAEDPRYPARMKAAEALHAYTSDWIAGYELDDGEAFHSPSEMESFLIADAFEGLTGDEEYQRLHRAWRELCNGPEAAAKALHGAVLGIIEKLVAADPSPDSDQGRVLVNLSAALEAYEKVMFPTDGAQPSDHHTLTGDTPSHGSSA